MKEHNIEPIPFSAKNIQASWLRNVERHYIENRTIVINLGTSSVKILEYPEKQIHPRASTILKAVHIAGAESVLMIRIVDQTNIGGVVLDPQWHQLGQIADYPKDVPLWKSKQFDLGIVHFDPFFSTQTTQILQTNRIKKYQVKVNLWFAPAKTNCAIHNHHMTPEFLEVHTQIYGTGRMQKFTDNNYDTLYQDDIMSPGTTHLPYASVNSESEFIYPWHQYYAETDCIWIANEFHPID